MFETFTTVMGRAIAEPRSRRLADGNEVVSFRMASNSRRRDRTSGEWVDGPSLYLTVVCWRRIAEQVVRAVHVGDAVIVHGHMHTNEYVAADGAKRADLELTATALGHDMAFPIREMDRGTQAERIDAPTSRQPTEIRPLPSSAVEMAGSTTTGRSVAVNSAAGGSVAVADGSEVPPPF